MESSRWDVDVVETACLGLAGKDFGNHIQRDRGGAIKVCVLVVLQRDGDACDAKKRPFDRRSDSSRVEHVDAGVETAVDAADHKIGPLWTKLRDAQLDCIGRTAVHGPPTATVTLKNLLSRQRCEKRDGMTNAALFSGRSHDVHRTDPMQTSLHRR